MPPPDRYVFDWDSPSANVDIEAFRVSVKQALTDLADHLEQLADSFLLGQTAADFAQTVLTNFTSLQAVVAGQAAQIAELQAQVAALQPPPTTAP